MIRDWALARLGTSARSTMTRSRRCFFGIRVVGGGLSTGRDPSSVLSVLRQKRLHPIRDALGVEIELGTKYVLRAMMDILIRNPDAVERHVLDLEVLRALHDRGAESSGQRSFLHRDDLRFRAAVAD